MGLHSLIAVQQPVMPNYPTGQWSASFIILKNLPSLSKSYTDGAKISVKFMGKTAPKNDLARAAGGKEIEREEEREVDLCRKKRRPEKEGQNGRGLKKRNKMEGLGSPFR